MAREFSHSVHFHVNVFVFFILVLLEVTYLGSIDAWRPCV